MTMTLKATHVYTARKRCGCRVAAAIDSSEFPELTAQAVADFIRDGLVIERVEKDRFEFDDCTHEQDDAP